MVRDIMNEIQAKAEAFVNDSKKVDVPAAVDQMLFSLGGMAKVVKTTGNIMIHVGETWDRIRKSALYKSALITCISRMRVHINSFVKNIANDGELILAATTLAKAAEVAIPSELIDELRGLDDFDRPQQCPGDVKRPRAVKVAPKATEKLLRYYAQCNGIPLWGVLLDDVFQAAQHQVANAHDYNNLVRCKFCNVNPQGVVPVTKSEFERDLMSLLKPILRCMSSKEFGRFSQFWKDLSNEAFHDLGVELPTAEDILWFIPR